LIYAEGYSLKIKKYQKNKKNPFVDLHYPNGEYTFVLTVRYQFSILSFLKPPVIRFVAQTRIFVSPRLQILRSFCESLQIAVDDTAFCADDQRP
jgi:hypothetical protein